MTHLRGRVLLLSLSISASGLPIYLIDTVAPQIQGNLHLSAADFGVINAVWFAASSASALLFGRRVDRKGGDSIMAIAVPTLSLSLLSIVLIQSFAQFLAAVLVCGLAGGTIPSSAYRVVWDSVPAVRMGLAFGVVQSGFATAAVLTGFAGPLLASTLGWRQVFAVCACVVLGIGMLVRRALAQPGTATPMVTPGRPGNSRSSWAQGRTHALRLILVMASIVANGATGALVTYLVLALVHRGLSDLAAGWVFAAGGVGAAAVRIAIGRIVDATHVDPFRLISGMLLVGAVAVLVMASGSVIYVAVAAVIGVAIGWGWTGLFGYSVVHLFPHSPGAASALVLSVAGGVGSAVGPFLMGLMIEHVGYGSTERVLSGVLLFAAAVMLSVRALIRQQVGT